MRQEHGVDDLLVREPDRLARPHDEGLLGGDRRQGVAKQVDVLKLDAGQDRSVDRHRRGRVEATTQPDLEDRQVHTLLTEQDQRRQGHRLEEAQRQRLEVQALESGRISPMDCCW